MQRTTASSRLKFFSTLGGSIVIFALAVAWIWHALEQVPTQAWNVHPKWSLVLVAALLVPANYGLETLKWHRLMGWGHMQDRLKEVLYGVSWSLVGPLRLGAVVGRVAAAPSAQKNQAIRAFACSGIAQGIATALGAAAALWFVDWNVWRGSIGAGQGAAMITSVVALGLTGLFLGWSPKFWTRLSTLGRLSSWGESRYIALNLRFFVLGLSLLRYLIFLFQFVLLLEAFHHAGVARLAGVDVFERVIDNMVSASLTWGFTTIIPSPLLGDLGVREAVALHVFTLGDSGDALIVVLAGATLWVLNLLLPALIGAGWMAATRRKS